MDVDMLPPVCARLLALAVRDPRRALPRARRAYAQAAPAQRAWVAYTLARVLLAGEQFAEAQPLIAEAQARFAAHGQAVPLLHCRMAALLLTQLGGAGFEAQPAWAQIVADYAAAGLPLDALRARFEQIAQLNALGHAPEALRLIARVEGEADTAGTPADRARLLRLRGVAHANVGALVPSEADLDAALAIYTHLRLPTEVARTLINRAWLFQQREQFARALADLERAQPVFEQFGLVVTNAFCLRDLGAVAQRQGQLHRAMVLTERARTHLLRFGRPSAVAFCDMQQGTSAYYAGLLEVAVACFRRAQHLFTQLGMRLPQLVSQRNQALVFRADGQPQAALDLLRGTMHAAQGASALEYAENIFAQGQVLHDLGRAAEARTCFQAARALFATHGNSGAEAECWLEAGWLALAAQDGAEAEHAFALALPALTGRPIHQWRVRYGLGRCALLRGRPAAALAHYGAALAIIRVLRGELASAYASSGLFAQARQLYADALALAAAQDEPATLLAIMSQQQALTLNQQLARAAFRVPPALHAAYEHQRATLRAQLAGDVRGIALDATLTSYLELLLHITNANQPLVRDVLAAVFDLDTLRQQLIAAYGRGWSALTYATTDDAIFVVALDAEGQAAQRIPFDPALRRALERATLPRYRAYTYLDQAAQLDRTQEAWGELARLGAALLPPRVRAQLHPQHRLVIVPSGPLHALAWAALRVGGMWLCEQAVIQTVPSLALWDVLARRDPPGHAALLLGCRTFAGRAPDLPHAHATLDLVAAYWRGPITTLRDAEVARAALLNLSDQGALARYGLIHLASHAQMVAARGLLAHIKLHDDDLLFDEVLRLRLGGALVVLAACEGAAGDVLPGDEVVSLSYALLAGGARAVVASLWPIYDQTVLELLRPFYGALAGGADAASALAAMQRTLIARHRSDGAVATAPLIWACWCVVGGGDAPQSTAGGTTPAAE